jgi:hypothetical protein
MATGPDKLHAHFSLHAVWLKGTWGTCLYMCFGVGTCGYMPHVPHFWAGTCGMHLFWRYMPVHAGICGMYQNLRGVHWACTRFFGWYMPHVPPKNGTCGMYRHVLACTSVHAGTCEYMPHVPPKNGTCRMYPHVPNFTYLHAFSCTRTSEPTVGHVPGTCGMYPIFEAGTRGTCGYMNFGTCRMYLFCRYMRVHAGTCVFFAIFACARMYRAACTRYMPHVPNFGGTCRMYPNSGRYMRHHGSEI